MKSINALLAVVYVMTLITVLPMVARADDGVPFRAIVSAGGGTLRVVNGPACAEPCAYTPYRTGSLDGYRALAVMMDNGTNGEADKAHIFVNAFGGNGSATADLGSFQLITATAWMRSLSTESSIC